MRSKLVIIEPPANHLIKRTPSDIKLRKTVNIVGRHHTDEHPSYPKVLVQDYDDPNEELIMKARCVTVENPKHESPFFKLYNPSGSKSSQVPVDCGTGFAKFSNLIVERIERDGTLAQIDHHRCSVDHTNYSVSINKTSFRLRFQAFTKKGSHAICAPVYSDPISTEEITSLEIMELSNNNAPEIIELSNNTAPKNKIIKLSNNTAPMTGGTEIILLCEKIKTLIGDVRVRFFCEEPAGCWEAYARDVYNHKKVALSFTTPAYTGMRKDCNQPVPALIELYLPDDRKWGEPEPFTFWPTPKAQFDLSTSRKRPSSTDVDCLENNAIVITPPIPSSTGSSSPIPSRMADPRVINGVVIIPPADISSSSSAFIDDGHLSPSNWNNRRRYSNSSAHSSTSTSFTSNNTLLDSPYSPTQLPSSNSSLENNDVGVTPLEMSLSELTFANADQFQNSNSSEYRSTSVTPTSYGNEQTTQMLNQPFSQLLLEPALQSPTEPNPDHNLAQMMIQDDLSFNLADFSND